MTPQTQRRLALFRANRRGYWSFWLCLALFTLSLSAEFIANDKPILVRYQNHFYMPVLRFTPETTFGGDFLTETDFRDPLIVQHINADGWMIWPLIHYSYRTINYDAVPTPSPPTRENWLGTDDQGRDVVARLLYGFRTSMLFGLFLTGISAAIGIAAGAVQGYFGGLTDLLAQRFIEIWSGLPELYVLIILASLLEPSFGWLLLILVLFSWTALVPLVRAEFLRARNFEYVRAARAMGLTEWVILRRHVLPNALVSAFTFLPFLLCGGITTLSTLDFLGLGLPPGSASLGELVAQGKTNLQAPWLGITGFVALAFLLSLLIFTGEAVRDAFDPRKTH